MRNSLIQYAAIFAAVIFISGSTGCRFNGGKWYSPNAYTWVNPFSPRGNNNDPAKPQDRYAAGVQKPSLDGKPNIDAPLGGYNNNSLREQTKTSVPETLAGPNKDASRLAAAPAYGGYTPPDANYAYRENLYTPNPVTPAGSTPVAAAGTAPAYNAGTYNAGAYNAAGTGGNVQTGYNTDAAYPGTVYQPTAGTLPNHPQPTNYQPTPNAAGTAAGDTYPSAGTTPAGTPAGTAPGGYQYNNQPYNNPQYTNPPYNNPPYNNPSYNQPAAGASPSYSYGTTPAASSAASPAASPSYGSAAGAVQAGSSIGTPATTAGYYGQGTAFGTPAATSAASPATTATPYGTTGTAYPASYGASTY